MRRLTPQQERFARLVAEGKMSQEAAYAAAGYCANNRNAGQLANRPHVKEFIANLRAKAARKSDVDIAYVISGLKKVADVGMREVPFEPVEGEIHERMTDPGAANKALELLGKTLGAFIDRTQVDLTDGARQYIERLVGIVVDEVHDSETVQRIIARIEREIGAGGASG